MDNREKVKLETTANRIDVEESTLLQGEIEDQSVVREDSKLLYAVDEKPPMLVMISLALQHAIICLPSCLSASIIVSDMACVPFGHPARSTMFSGTIFMAGLASIMQTAVGVRMPIFQGPADTFLIPLKIVSSDPIWKCPNGSLEYQSPHSNWSNDTMGRELEDGMYWRLQTISGSLMLASLLEIILGASGALHIIMRYISPITVAVSISIIPIPLTGFVIHYSSPNFPMALCTALLVVVFALYMRRLKIPIPSCRKGRANGYFPLFQVLPVLLAMAIMWVIAGILTTFDVFTNDKTSPAYYARTDAKISLIENTPWILPVYPGRFGTPRCNLMITIGFLLAILSSMVESVGDYYTAQRACHLKYLPKHAVARGILAEGVASLISGSVGVGHATTSFSTNISMLALSKSVSRCIMYTAGIFYISLSLIGKFGAAFITIPTPIIGGTLIIVLGLILSIGLSNLAFVDMTSSRNLLVFGVPFISAIILPAIIEKDPSFIQTGSISVDAMIRMLLQNPIFLGGIMAFVLDNTVPGDYEARGMRHHEGHEEEAIDASDNRINKIFSWNNYSKILKKFPFLKHFPFLPHFKPFRFFKTKDSLPDNEML